MTEVFSLTVTVSIFKIIFFLSLFSAVFQLPLHLQNAWRHQELGGCSYELRRYCHEFSSSECHWQICHKGRGLLFIFTKLKTMRYILQFIQ